MIVAEWGKRNISLVNLEVIAKGFDVPVSRLLARIMVLR
jgi:hypothetical protein